MRLMTRSLMAAALALVIAVPASAATITFVDLGTAAPPATLGGQSMTAFGDTTPNFTTVGSIASPLGGSLGFSPSVEARTIGSGWATWSHGYTGEVFYSLGATSVTMTMPTGTTAFYFYGEPNPFSVFSFTATATDGTVFTSSGPLPIDGSSGARGFGFYTGDGSISSITFGGDIDFAIGEFGIASVPEPATLLLLGSGLLAGAARRRRARR